MSLRPATRRKLRFLGGFALYFIALWLLWPTPIVYPLKIFVVLLHELSHGLMAVATGGTIERIQLTANEGGATFTRGGSALLTLSAGYLGSLLWGLGLLTLARARPMLLRGALFTLGAILLAVSVLYVRGLFGFIVSLLFALGLMLAAARLRPRGQRILLFVLGLTSALYALLDIRSDIFQRPGAESDAHLLAQLTGIPTLFWGIVWSAIALALCWIVMRREFRAA